MFITPVLLRGPPAKGGGGKGHSPCFGECEEWLGERVFFLSFILRRAACMYAWRGGDDGSQPHPRQVGAPPWDRTRICECSKCHMTLKFPRARYPGRWHGRGSSVQCYSVGGCRRFLLSADGSRVKCPVITWVIQRAARGKRPFRGGALDGQVHATHSRARMLPRGLNGVCS